MGADVLPPGHRYRQVGADDLPRPQAQHRSCAQLPAGEREGFGQLDERIDIIVSGGAFEWFDKPRFIDEARRLMPGGGPVVILWSWLEPLDQVSHRWYWLMRRVLGAHVGPEPDDAVAMAAGTFPSRQSWKVVRSRHTYSATGLHDFLRSSSYWRADDAEMRARSRLLVERFVAESAQANGDVELTFREVGFLGHLEARCPG
jgi:hypothetical protein